jgi:hypothetical protein
MKPLVFVFAVILGAAVWAQRGETPTPGARPGAEVQGQRGGGPGLGLPGPFTPPPGAVEIPYTANANLLKLPPDVGTLGEVVGVAQDSKGNIYAYTRAAHQRLYEFDKTGKYVREIGKDMYAADFAHVVRVDKDDNVWIVDEGSNMVVKFNQAGEVTLTLGRKWELVEGRPEQPARGAPPPVARPNAFNRPTDVTWDVQGNIFVADGYNNSRVAKFAKNGDWVKSVGQRGTGPSEFNTPHSIAADAKGNIYVGDRANNRIQVFDSDLTYLKELKGFGSPWTMCITPGTTQYLYTADPNGHIFKLDLDGKVLGWLGKYGHEPGQFQWIHELHCSSENELLVGEIQNWRMQKLTLRPPARGSTASR